VPIVIVQGGAIVTTLSISSGAGNANTILTNLSRVAGSIAIATCRTIAHNVEAAGMTTHMAFATCIAAIAASIVIVDDGSADSAATCNAGIISAVNSTAATVMLVSQIHDWHSTAANFSALC
jgi:hypothetical protein